MTNTIQYLIESSINGQHTQCEVLIKKHGHTMKAVQTYMTDNGHEDSYTLRMVIRLYNPLIKQMLGKH